MGRSLTLNERPRDTPKINTVIFCPRNSTALTPWRVGHSQFSSFFFFFPIRITHTYMYVFSFYKLWQNNRHPFSRVVTPITAVGSSLLRAETRETRRLMLAALHFKTAPGCKKIPLLVCCPFWFQIKAVTHFNNSTDLHCSPED